MMRLISLSLLAVLLLTGCKKKENEVEKNYFYCKINGEQWGRGYAGDPTNSLLANWDTKEKTLHLSFFHESVYVTIRIADSLGPRSADYALDNVFFPNSGRYTTYKANGAYVPDNYDTGPINTGNLHVIYDAATNHISGTFAFTGINARTNVTAAITDGRFSVPCRLE